MADEASSNGTGRVRFVEPSFTVVQDSTQDSHADQTDGAGRPRASTLPGRPYGALPRALSGSSAGPEQGILSTPYKRYGSPYPGVYGTVEEDYELDSKADKTSLDHNLLAPLRSFDLNRHYTDGDIAIDQEDESLQRYKESLGLGGGGKDLSDPNDPRVCIIYSLAMHSEGRAPVVIDLSTPGSEQTLKEKPFKIKEGAKFTMTAKFKVQHEILSGLHYVQAIKRKGIPIGGKTSEMIVSSHQLCLVCLILTSCSG